MIFNEPNGPGVTVTAISGPRSLAGQVFPRVNGQVSRIAGREAAGYAA
jgi:hypothetical protein